MANEQGGYRQPAVAAPVSGPGALSRRTDGGATEGMAAPMQTQAPKYMPGLGYGQGGANMSNQQAAPLAGNPVAAMTPPPVPLTAPTQRPNEPITAGVDLGPGPGSEAIQIPNTSVSASHTIRTIAQNDPTGQADLLYRVLLDRGF